MLVRSFTRRLGFKTTSNYPSYRILADNNGAHLHLNRVAEDWIVPGGNPFGVYLYTQKVDALAAELGDLLLQKPEHKPWGMYRSETLHLRKLGASPLGVFRA